MARGQHQEFGCNTVLVIQLLLKYKLIPTETFPSLQIILVMKQSSWFLLDIA